MKTAEERFDAKVNFDGATQVGQESPCWLWIGGRKATGYGTFFAGQTRNAHRWNYERHNGPIPEGLVIDHLCRVRHCVNPGHMEIVTQAENNARSNSPTARNARKSHCPQGHPLVDGNLVRYHLAIGQRMCRSCANERQNRRRASLQSAVI